MSGRVESSAENILIKPRVRCDAFIIYHYYYPTSFLFTTDEPSRILKCITAPIVDDRTCESTLQDYIYWSHGMICAGRADTDNCLVSMFTAQKNTMDNMALNLTCHPPPPTPSLPPTVE